MTKLLNTIKIKNANDNTVMVVKAHNLLENTSRVIYTGKLGDLAFNKLQQKLHVLARNSETLEVYVIIDNKEIFAHHLSKY